MVKRIGEILVEAGVLETAQVDRALQMERLPGERLGSLLVRMGWISEELLVKALAKQLKLPVLDLGNLEIPDKVLSTVPRELLLQYQLVPVALKTIGGKTQLIVAMADPTMMQVISLLEGQIPYSIRPGIAPETLVKRTLYKHFGPPGGPAKAPAAEDPGEETEERTESVSVKFTKIGLARKPLVPQEASEDGEVTMLTNREPALQSNEENVVRELTEPTHPRIRLADLEARRPETKSPAASAAPETPGRTDLRDFVKDTNKNILLEAMLQLLLDRRIFTLEDLMAAVELKK